jgi:hypothetical protein
MSRAKRSSKKEVKTPAKSNARDTKAKEPPHKDVPKLRITPGAGWNADNFNYLKSVPLDQLSDSIYKMFDIPLLYMDDDRHAAIRIFVEFHVQVFHLAVQFPEIYKSMKVIAMLSDYLACVPAFASSRDSFSDWVARARIELENGDFSRPDVQLIEGFIESNLRPNAHVLHFVLTHDIVRTYDREGLKLFRTVLPVKQEKEKKQAAAAAADLEKKLEVVEAFVVVDEGLNEAKFARERELQEQMKEFIAEKFEEINEVVERRQEQLLTQIVAIQEALDGTAKKGKRPE